MEYEKGRKNSVRYELEWKESVYTLNFLKQCMRDLYMPIYFYLYIFIYMHIGMHVCTEIS